MGEFSKIEWTTHTFNPWIGCTKVSAACTNCYAETDTFARVSRGRGLELWGPKAERHVTSDANWRKPISWNREAARLGERHRVFCASLSDVFDVRHDAVGEKLNAARERLWLLIKATPALDWLLLTKRPENAMGCLPSRWLQDGLPASIWLGITTEDQATYDERWPIAAAVPAAVHFVSYEPAMGPLTLKCAACGGNTNTHAASDGGGCSGQFPDWAIVGGESGPKARPFDIRWADSILEQCQGTRIKPFVKQLGALSYAGTFSSFAEWVNKAKSWIGGTGAQCFDARGRRCLIGADFARARDDDAFPVKFFLRRGDKGGDWSTWPTSLCVREFPELAAGEGEGT